MGSSEGAGEEVAEAQRAKEILVCHLETTGVADLVMVVPKLHRAQRAEKIQVRRWLLPIHGKLGVWMRRKYLVLEVDNSLAAGIRESETLWL